MSNKKPSPPIHQNAGVSMKTESSIVVGTMVYITKWLSDGVIKTGIIQSEMDNNYFSVNGYMQCFSRKELAFTLEEAMSKFETKRQEKIKSLQKQITKWESLKPIIEAK